METTDIEIERECVWYGLVWSKSNKFIEKRKKQKERKKKIYEYFLYRIAVKRNVSLQIVIVG